MPKVGALPQNFNNYWGSTSGGGDPQFERKLWTCRLKQGTRREGKAADKYAGSLRRKSFRKRSGHSWARRGDRLSKNRSIAARGGLSFAAERRLWVRVERQKG